MLPAQESFASPDHQVVQEHGPDHGKNHGEIKLADPADGDAANVGGERCIDVHLAESKLLAYPGVALAAGLHEVSVVDGGPRIVRRQNVVHAVATGTVGYDLRAQFRRQAVVAGQVGGGTAARDSEFLR